MSVEVTWDKAKWDAFVKKIETKINFKTTDKILEAVAYEGLKIFVKTLYHIRKTGALERSWIVLKLGFGGEYLVASTSKVALFLEEGTKAHGPKTGRWLYIPLRKGAATWRKGFIYGQDYVLAKRVKGIMAKHYLKPISEKVLKIMVKKFENYLARVA